MQRQRVQFIELVLQQLYAGGALVALFSQGFEFLLGFVVLARQPCDLAGQIAGAGADVEQFALVIFLQQRLMLVLTVNVHQMFAQGAHILQG